jgi:hypothetical protein
MTVIDLTAGGDEDEEEEEEEGEEQEEQLWAPYRAESLGPPHPCPVVESAAVARVKLPPCSYPIKETLGPQIEGGMLSDLQIEGIRYACARHRVQLPGGERAGFILGDSTGIGKGRQIAGIILDSIARGRPCHLWVSCSAELFQDARRDFRDLGARGVRLLDGIPDTPPVTTFGGNATVIFCTYAQLVTGAGKSTSRFNKLTQTLGHPLTFEGVIVFDECHRAKGVMSGTESAAHVVRLQEKYPSARIVYASATGFGGTDDMGYLIRAGLWGPGTPFATYKEFRVEVKTVGAMESLAMELKRTGTRVARQLSFQGAEFKHVIIELSREQSDAYYRLARLWADILPLVPKSGLAAYWGAHLRHMRALLTSFKVAETVRITKEKIAAGMAVIIGIQSTGEAALESGSPPPSSEIFSACREIAEQFVQSNVPGDVSMLDQLGLCKKLVDMVRAKLPIRNREDILARIRAETAFPPSTLDLLIENLGGPEAVSEMTGRGVRFVRGKGGLFYAERRDETRVHEELRAFCNGRKHVAVLSDKASTGFSLHADPSAPKPHRRRVHLTLELPWSAEAALQQLGRSHRAGQVSAPQYILISSSAAGEARFTSSIAEKLRSLGALGQGDGRARGPLGELEALDGPAGAKAMRRLLRDSGAPPGPRTGLGEEAPADGPWGKKDPHGVLQDARPLLRDVTNVRQFLNRVLAFPPSYQRYLFGAFQRLLREECPPDVTLRRIPGKIVRDSGPPVTLPGIPIMAVEVLIDRGIPYAEAIRRARGKPHVWTRTSRAVMKLPGSALLCPWGPASGKLEGARPVELGPSFERIWTAEYERSAGSCIHGDGCTCQLGRRIYPLAIVSGPLYLAWRELSEALGSEPMISAVGEELAGVALTPQQFDIFRMKLEKLAKDRIDELLLVEAHVRPRGNFPTPRTAFISPSDVESHEKEIQAWEAVPFKGPVDMEEYCGFAVDESGTVISSTLRGISPGFRLKGPGPWTHQAVKRLVGIRPGKVAFLRPVS